MKISGSVVLFHNKKEEVLKSIRSFLNTELDAKIYLLDNSFVDDLKELSAYDQRIVYTFNNINLGYGSAHNIAIKKSISDDVHYHLVLNPDVYFERGVLEKLISFMEKNKDIANVMPNILYPDGSTQYLCKLLPSPVDLIFRRFIPLKAWKEKRNNMYELRFTDYKNIMNVPSLSGCFMFLRIEALKKVGIFDENIFMYLEDVDLNRRLHQKYKTVFYPAASVYHAYGKESYKNKKLLMYHIRSAIYYFNKWGWFFDSERKFINRRTLNVISNE
ncbi:glycosyl transferase family 2 [Chloroherpeton thalassium ATCC 35110]|uniref:Glycosyl transferase family 2 n=1 Tax=Chloroherpeton thalassium (strain ATCC 35110 / GB-78) TaxID=517418 RepID=B3QVC4_CHLT3|nr:glycosyltransferase family 2 protein [Chloroherpeton thalassium]ACF14524.1 glycosyl transferase family 2 [Chloroherpeton thalassium ATCC 35110]